eukprot:209178-Pelagomonas_calceolata.AAC.4
MKCNVGFFHKYNKLFSKKVKKVSYEAAYIVLAQPGPKLLYLLVCKAPGKGPGYVFNSDFKQGVSGDENMRPPAARPWVALVTLCLKLTLLLAPPPWLVPAPACGTPAYVQTLPGDLSRKLVPVDPDCLCLAWTYSFKHAYKSIFVLVGPGRKLETVDSDYMCLAANCSNTLCTGMSFAQHVRP